MRFTEEFRNPGPAYRAKPFWAWNGRLDKEELLRQIDCIAEMGFGGFFMHSRTGLGTPYLSDEWFDLINACADKGKALGLEAWLYDEDRWPSGTAGGAVTQNPLYRMHFLRMSEEHAGAEGDPLIRFAVTREGEYLTGYRTMEEGDMPRDGESVLRFDVVEMPCSSFYNGTAYVDTMNRAATDVFLELTHEKYAEHCGSRIGDSILGIFTDEPRRGSLMTSFGQGVSAGERQIPWTAELPRRFQEKFGVRLLENLPALFLKKDEKPALIKWQYIELLEELFLENFARQTGALERLPYTPVGDSLRIPLDFDAKAMLLISVGKNYAEAEAPDDFEQASSKILDGPFPYELDEPNICVLDFARVSIDGGGWSEELEVLRADRRVRDAFALPHRGGEMLQPWFAGQRCPAGTAILFREADLSCAGSQCRRSAGHAGYRRLCRQLCDDCGQRPDQDDRLEALQSGRYRHGGEWGAAGDGCPDASQYLRAASPDSGSLLFLWAGQL